MSYTGYEQNVSNVLVGQGSYNHKGLLAVVCTEIYRLLVLFFSLYKYIEIVYRSPNRCFFLLSTPWLVLKVAICSLIVLLFLAQVACFAGRVQPSSGKSSFWWCIVSVLVIKLWVSILSVMSEATCGILRSFVRTCFRSILCRYLCCCHVLLLSPGILSY